VKIENGLVSLSHQTVRDFFLHDPQGTEFLRRHSVSIAVLQGATEIAISISMEAAVAETCFRYLLFEDFEPDDSKL
jgi:hypothetical protein